MSDRAERVKKIILLLQHRLDYLPTSGLAQSFPSKPGAQPTHRVACGCARLVAWQGRGEFSGFKMQEWTGDPACLLCKGSGFRSRIKKLDGDDQQDERGAIYDPYTFAHDRSAKAGSSGGLRVMTREETDRELARLRADEHARAGIHSKREAYGWERARERRDKSGSFRELDHALDTLSVKNPALRSLLDNVFRGVYGPGRIPRGASEAYWQALLFIEARMPDPVRVPQFLTDARVSQERRESVLDTYKRTGSISKTAFSHGLRKRRVKATLREAGLIQ